MSKVIDTKIVEMSFENDKFEKGVATSIGTIDKLKSSLKFDRTVDSLSGISTAARGLNLSSLLDGITAAQTGFIGLASIGIAQINRIVTAAVDAGVRIAKALTIDPIKAGLNEYETKLNSVQTILANTQKEGTTLEIVTKALNDLNEYSDKTIYNFQEMTRNVGTFTAAGVKLQTSVDAIKGIANLAAISGSNSQQASTAMYQLSQALSTGTVKLMDWNSVVNAGMGGQVFQDAIKETARVHGVAIDQIIAEQGSFRDSLQKGWFTSEILTETLAKFTGDLNEDQLRTMGYSEEQIKSIIKMGQTASDAATKVKTFTQLFDTLKEAAQSGWAQTWEIIIGDFEEAKAFLTELNNIFGAIIGDSAESRNSLLEGWKELGGRDGILDSVRNILKSILSIIKPITDAMYEIFPPVTSTQLFALTDALRNFTSKLILTEKGADTLKRIFKGVFAFIDILVYGFSALTKSVFGFATTLGPASNFLLEFLANIGDFVVSLRDAIRKADTFSGVLNVIKILLLSGTSAFSKFFDTVVNVVSNFRGIKLDGFINFIDKLKSGFKPLNAISSALVKVLNFFKLALSKIAPIAIRLAEIVSESVSKFMDKMSESLGRFQPERVINILNGGLLSGLLLAIKKFIDNGSGIFGGVSDILDSVKGSLEAWQSTLKADVLLKIAAALGIMALSIWVLASIDQDKLTGALVAMTTMFVQLGISLSAFEKISANSNLIQMGTMALGLIAISSAMLLMALAVRALGTMNSKELVKGMLAIVSMIGIFSLSSKTLSNSSGDMITGAFALVIFSFAIRSLTKAVETLGEIDTNSLISGLIGVGVIMAELAIFMKSSSLSGLSLSNVLGILILSGAISILASSVDKLSTINGDNLAKALTALAVILTELSLFVYATAGGSTLLLTAAGVGVIAIALLTLTEVMERLGALSWEAIGRGLTAMAGALILIGAASYLLPPTMLAQAASLVVMGIALVILADAMTKLGSMTWDEVGRGITALAASLIILAFAMNVMTGSIAGAAALFVASAALMMLAPALKILGSMSWDEIARGLVALAATFLVLGIAGALMTPVIPTLLSLGGAMLLIGAGTALAGIGLLAFSAGLSALAVSGAAGASALVVIISSIVGLIPMIIATLGRALLALVDVLVQGAPTLLKGIVLLLNILLDGLIQVIPKIIDVVILFVEKIVTTLAEKMPIIVQAGYDILKGFLEGVRANIGDVVTVSIDIINAYLTAIADKIPEIVDSGWNLIISWINGMKEGVEAHLPELMTAVQELGIAIIKGLASGIIDGRNTAVDAIKELAQMVIDEFKYILGINSPSTVFIEFAGNMISGLVNGLKNNAHQVINSITELAEKIVKTLKGKYSSMVSAGSDLVSGFGRGIRSLIGDAVTAATQLAKAALTAIKTTLGINSPAKELISVGKFIDLGLVAGISKFSKNVISSINNLGDGMLSNFSDIVSRISDTINGNMDFSPTITPVIDISNIESGSKQINSMFGDIGITPNLSLSKARSISVDTGSQNLVGQPSSANTQQEVTFIQHNTSPKALSPVEIYRNTKNLLARSQKVIGA